MLAKFLGLDEVGPITYMEWYLRHPWPGWLVFLLVALAAGAASWLYYRERAIPTGRKTVLLALRALLVGLVVLLLFEPSFALEMEVNVRQSLLVLLDASESMAIDDPRKQAGDFEEAALALGTLPYKQAGANPGTFSGTGAASPPRWDLAKGILNHKELKLFERLEGDYQVRFFRFGDRLEPLASSAEDLRKPLGQASPEMKATALGTAVEEAVSHYGGQAISGVIVLTDGASNQGRDPLEVARRMKDAGIPIYPVGLGLPNPPDLQIRNLVCQEVVFKGDEARLRAQVVGTGYENRSLELVLKLGEEEMGRESVKLTGQEQFVEMSFVPKEAGRFRLELSAPPLPDETLAENNRISQTIRVIDETIKVLYIEGNPRWEYRYLRQVLLRDHRLNVKFIMTEGDADLARYDNRYLNRFPLEKKEAFYYDLVILGDVRMSFFQPEELQRIEELVRERGGSFLLLAGQQHAPKEYVGSPVAAMLPVKLRDGEGDAVDELVTPMITPIGRKSSVVRLEMEDSENDQLWSLVRPLYQVPRLEGMKAGATLLSEMSDSVRRNQPYPLMAWQRYGTGKVLFVGTDQLWRLRFKRGDKYHARFWGQAIQFLTLSRLLGENKQITVQTDRREYWNGEPARIYANVLNESFEPVTRASFDVFIEKAEAGGRKEKVELLPVPDSAGLFQGFYTPEKDGRYVLKPSADDEAVSNAAEIEVTTKPLEQIDSAMHEGLLRKVAELSGGKYFSIREIPGLPDAFVGATRTSIVRREKELWDLPLVFVVLLALAGSEWFLRRRFNLL